VEENLPEPKARDARTASQEGSRNLPARKVLIIDDDMRNIFALTSLLERYDMQVLYGRKTGRTASIMLKNMPGISDVRSG